MVDTKFADPFEELGVADKAKPNSSYAVYDSLASARVRKVVEPPFEFAAQTNLEWM
jgi:hypothetical protein